MITVDVIERTVIACTLLCILSGGHDACANILFADLEAGLPK